MELLSFALQKAFADEETGQRYVEGLASTEDPDWQNDTVIQTGADFRYLQKGAGRVNWDHNKPIIIGDTVNAALIPEGWMLKSMLYRAVDGHTCSSSFAKSIDKAEYVWDYMQTVQKNGGKPLAYSVEGPPPKRIGNRIIKSLITAVAITDKPVNTNCTIKGLIKSFNQYMDTPGLSASDIRDGGTFVRYMEDHGIDPEETRLVYDNLRNLILGVEI